MTDLRSLRTLLAVVEYGSIHLAARSLFVSHSTASRQIRSLEEHFATALFERSSAGVSPTAQCLAVADFARRTIAESELLADSFGEYSGAVETVSIVTSTGLGQTVVADAINDVMRMTDRVQFSVIDRGSLEALQVLRNRRADLCVNFSISGDGLGDVAGVRTVAKTEVRNCAVLDRSHPLAARSHLFVRDLTDYPVATLPAGNTARIRLEQAVRALGQVFSPALEASCPILQVRSAIGTELVVLMSERSVPDNLEADPRRSSESLDLTVEALRAHLAG